MVNTKVDVDDGADDDETGVKDCVSISFSDGRAYFRGISRALSSFFKSSIRS